MANPIVTFEMANGDIMKAELYPEVASKHNTTAAKVERSIRHAIEVCWLKGRIDILEDAFGYTINYDKGDYNEI